MKHKADGLYYFNRSMLVKTHACYTGVNDVSKAFGEEPGDILVTLENVRTYLKADPNYVSFPLERAARAYGVEFDADVDVAIDAAVDEFLMMRAPRSNPKNVTATAKAFMDAVWAIHQARMAKAVGA